MNNERYHQRCNGLGKYAVVKETAMKNLARDLDVETVVGCTGGDAPVKPTIKGKILFNDDGSFEVVNE